MVLGKGAAGRHRVRTAVRQRRFLQSLVGTKVRVLVKFLGHCHIPPLSLRLTPQNDKICSFFVFPQTILLYYRYPHATVMKFNFSLWSLNSVPYTVRTIASFRQQKLKYKRSVKINMTYIHVSLFHRAFRFTKFYLYQRMHLFLSYTKIT